MKYITLLLFLIMNLNLYAQKAPATYFIDFESPNPYSNVILEIDTVNNTNNAWQIGTPNKTILNSCVSGSNALITDTAYSYPAKDTSYFYIKIYDQPVISKWFFITYNYQSYCFGDTAFLEYSPDNGINWCNLNDTNYSNCYPQQNPWGPGNDWNPLTGDNSWTERTVFIYADVGHPYYPELVTTIDTLLFRFSFFSDTDSTNNDNGVVIDDIKITITWPSSIEENVSRNNLFFPNPNEGYVNIMFVDNLSAIKVFDKFGRLVQYHSNAQNLKTLDLTALENGVYFIVAEFNLTNSQIIEKILILK